MSTGKGICFQWQRNGVCRFGTRCKFKHAGSATAPLLPSSARGGQKGGICRIWQQSGTCRYGNSCKFNHPGSRGNNSTSQKVPKVSSSGNDIAKFLKHISQVHPSQLGKELEQSASLWHRCWHEHVKLDRRGREMLVESLAKSPGSTGVDPPPIAILEAALCKYLNEASSSNEAEVLTRGKTSLAAVTRLLQFEWDPPKNLVQDGLCSIAIAAEAIMQKQHKSHRVVSADLMGLIEKIEKSWNIKLKENVLICHDVGDEEAEPATFADWKTANIKWLCNPYSFSPSCCPRMKVGQEGVYEDSKDYMDTVYQLWIAMTFSDGHAAFAPHCRARGNNGSGCGSALSPTSATTPTDRLRCRTSGCRRPVEFKCRINNHDSLCTDCAMRSISNHQKGPKAGAKASTHIYDCRIDRVSEDGVLYLTEFKSRNPPPNVHWRTTKRLSPPNLVGVVKTRAKGAALEDQDKIKWGECVYHADSRNESQRRDNGELAINVSTIVDCDPEYFQEGTYVAIIDCMTFVPEWVPVLKALEKQKEIELPFDGGKYLNLLKDKPVEMIQINDVEDAVSLRHSELIEKTVEASTLEPIREIRRYEEEREELITRLDQLVQQATLDKGQLLSFLAALQHPVHLTQGPPGTGKSYLGVVLVRALLIIRELWLKKATDRAPPPILILSYKNHAIDEFLVDLARAEPTKMRNKLIRIGGQCKDVRLAMYSERNTYQSDPTVRQKRKCLEDLNALRASIRATVEGEIASFLAFREAFRSEDDTRTRQQILVKAAETLMEMVARRDLLKESFEKLEEGKLTTPVKAVDQFRFLEVVQDTTFRNQGITHSPSDIVTRRCQKLQSDALVPALSQQVAHYDNELHFGDILVMFLCGKVPLPPCDVCQRPAFDPEVSLCDLHRCRDCANDTSTLKPKRCDRACRSERSDLCSLHACDIKTCSGLKLENHKYCLKHCCRICLEEYTKVSAQSQSVTVSSCRQARGEPPRNVCESHQLCISPGCLLLACRQRGQAGYGAYCEKHFEPSCQALSKKKKPCQTPPISRSFPFCIAHKHLAGDLLDFSSDDDDDSDSDAESREGNETPQPRQLCVATTTKGRGCKGTALPGKKFCYDHDMTAEEPDIASQESKLKQDGDDDCASLPSGKAGDNSATAEQMHVLVPADLQSREIPVGDIEDDWHSTQSLHSDGSIPQVEEAAAMDFDEIEFVEGDNLQHLREVYEIAPAAGDEFFPGEDVDNDEVSIDAQAQGLVLSDIPGEGGNLMLDSTQWSWTMTADERWGSCQLFLADLRESMAQASAIVKNCVVAARKEHQAAIVRAKARMYENKTVIGGTMVGCISRLEPIRATRPFAVVVEEASEVLEPLLFSCLTESTIKLEMVGDHRQLQPSVMSRYEFELNNKINISMFQRLIEAPEGHEIPSTVLSVQRRMRTNICDLTREYYADVVDIKDDDRCMQQRIGDRNSLPNTSVVSATLGREVPGIGPHAFLWTHDGDQKRSTVGISRINPVEANMACSLAKYLVSCGVAKSSIAILTPYKGQLMEMRKMLLQGSPKLLSRDPQNTDVCRLSTVDRFQGDEEDIVICSLVVDEKSKTNFVKLVNRMIVLLSRARLGLYILANGKYFQSSTNVPKHWQRTLELLEAPGSNDSSIQSIDDSSIFAGRRSGNELPLCCPIHRCLTSTASSAAQLKLGFCSEICQDALPCGHACRLSCHWPRSDHNQRCEVEVDSPCLDHPKKLTCRQLYQEAKGCPLNLTYQQALPFFRCPGVVPVALPCKHEVKKACWAARKIVSGEITVPICLKKSPDPFSFPSCDHTLEVTCEKLKAYNIDPTSVKCQQLEVFEPPCGHDMRMKCWQYQQYTSGVQSFVCEKDVEMVLPWCGHSNSIPCSTARTLASWDGVRCEEVGKVVEGVKYGPLISVCQEQVTLVRACGHEVRTTCNKAMTKSCSWKVCRESLSVLNPDCGHNCRITCSNATSLKDQAPTSPRNKVIEGQIPAPVPYLNLLPRCSEKVQLTRKCGHVDVIECCDARKPQQKCRVETHTKSPLCGHMVNVACAWKNWSDEVTFWDTASMVVIESSGLIPHSSHLLHNASPTSEGLQALRLCKERVGLELKCGHQLTIDCRDILKSMSDRESISSSCDQEMTATLHCGHTVKCLCSDAQRVRAGKKHSLVCRKSTPRKCWNFNACGSTVNVECSLSGSVGCDKISEWICPRGLHKFNLALCSDGIPTECPTCVTEELLTRVDTINADNSVRDAFQNAVNDIPSASVAVLDTDDDGLIRTKDRLRRFINKNKNASTWEKEVPHVQRIPCFRMLSDSYMSATSFEPRLFVNKKSMNGMMTRTLTASNIAKLSPKKQIGCKLLVGYATILKTKDHRHARMPQKKGKSNLVSYLWQNEYDSILYTDKGFETLVLWDPFPIESVLAVSLKPEELPSLAEKLEDIFSDITAKEPGTITFSLPDDLVTSPRTDNTTVEEDDASIDSAEEQIELVQSLAHSKLEGFKVNLQWTGGITGKMKRTVENNILNKMEFVNTTAKPFQGMNLIESMINSRAPPDPILHLLLAAESVKHSPQRAESELCEYLRLGRQAGQEFRLHPWSMVISARLENQHAKQLLSAYSNQFPLNKDILTVDELALVNDTVQATETATVSWSDKLKEEWSQLMDETPGLKSDAMDELLQLIGLRKVKEEALRLWRSSIQLQKMDAATRKQNPITANYCFLGNPGTGKTSVARLFTAILHDSSVRDESVFIETSAQKAKDDGVDEFRKHVQQALNGVLFIDEAYDLDPIGDLKGKPIVNELLTVCENQRDQISVILAGYEDDFEKKFFAYNPGLRSRFTTVIFDDFDEDDLSTIWKGMRKEKKWREKDGVCRVAVKRMLKLAGRKGFGNAREVRVRLERATQEALGRLGDNFTGTQEEMEICVSDVIGEDPRLASEKLAKVRDQFNEKIGWGRIKKQVEELLKICGVNYSRELQGLPPLDIFFNRMFLGNPGTGKTTCAKMYGRLMKELGLLSNGDVVFKTASDFKGSVIGESEKVTNQILDASKGKVLIIDEAYALDDDWFGKQVLDTLVEKVQGQPSDDRAVILVGYEEPMLEMIRKQNPGLSRRFPNNQAFYFDDYDEKELLAILNLNLTQNEVEASLEFRQKALEVLGVQKQQAHFGNAGAVETLVKSAMVKASERCTSEEAISLEEQDIPDLGTERGEKGQDPLSILDSLYRMEDVRAKIEQMTKSWEVSRKEGDDDPKLGHFVFTGSPGTGKTTVARAIADVLFSLGLLPTNKCFETSALDLTADYVGQTTTKVDNVLQEAKGGILFIDEAYNLGHGHFGKEACDSIVAGMTSEKFKDVVIIIAGYPFEIDEMLKTNSGLKSRFNHFFQFPDWTPSDCGSFFENLSTKHSFELEDGIIGLIQEGCSTLIQYSGWANGRDVTKLWEAAKGHRDVRVYDDVGMDKIFKLVDVEKAISEMVVARTPKTPTKSITAPQVDLAPENFDFNPRDSQPPNVQVSRSIQQEHNDDVATEAAVSDEETTVCPDDDTNNGRDPGVPDSVWAELEDSKRKEREEAEAMKELKDRLEALRAEEEASDRKRSEAERLRKEAAEILRQLEVEAEEAERKRIEDEMRAREEEIRLEEERIREIERLRKEKERELQRLEEERRQKEETQRKLQQLRPCPAGYSWHHQENGWRCSAGGHFVSDSELRRSFTS